MSTTSGQTETSSGQTGVQVHKWVIRMVIRSNTMSAASGQGSTESDQTSCACAKSHETGSFIITTLY